MELSDLLATPVGSWTGRHCRAARLGLSLSQENMAKQLGYSRQGLQQIEGREEPVERVVELSLRWLVEKLLLDQSRADPLLAWHQRGGTQFEQLVRKRGQRSSTLNNYQQYSYVLHPGKIIPANSLLNVMHQAERTVRNFSNTSFRLFYPYTRPEIAPYFTADEGSGIAMADILESAVFPDNSKFADTFDLWRFHPQGYATHVRAYLEDREDSRTFGQTPGKWFCPLYLVRHLVELLWHSIAVGEQIPTDQLIEFRCEWRGLKGRVIADVDPDVHWEDCHVSMTDTLATSGKWDMITVRRDWAEVVAALCAPTMRRFHPTFDLTPEWVVSQTRRFARL